jgi:hypothetical protein
VSAIKEITGLRNLRLKGLHLLEAISILLVVPGMGFAGSCLAPVRPFVPSDSQSMRYYRDIIRQDFDDYISNIQSYFHCLEAERGRAFEEAREVSEDYGRLLQAVGG